MIPIERRMGYGMENRIVGVQFSAGATDFTFINHNKTDFCWGTQGLLPSRGMIYFPLGQIGRGHVVKWSKVRVIVYPNTKSSKCSY
jgi:hypothetical protein